MEKVIIYGYTKCTTVKKAIKFLEEKQIKYKHIDNVQDKLSEKELTNIHKKSNQDIKKLFNTSGIKYRELNLKEKLENLELEEKLKLLATDGMLVKRPILLTENSILIGFKKDEWETKLKFESEN